MSSRVSAVKAAVVLAFAAAGACVPLLSRAQLMQGPEPHSSMLSRPNYSIAAAGYACATY